ncbi:BH3-interacting domain death agonist-like, partial [Neovison vison]|uniref:BH3-interacting domain death agonist-like n=1 Tax=Neovison vison TaxID=452646 RepID=UPI001CEFD642
LVVFVFLQSYSDSNFHQELKVLGRELPMPAHLQEEQDYGLQTEGNRCSHFLVSEERVSQGQEEIIQDIARKLAKTGDNMDRSIHPGLVNNLATEFVNRRLSEEDRRQCLTAALERVMQTYPTDMEDEKTILILAMFLAKKVADHTPSLLREVFHTTVNFINQNLFTYVRNLFRNEMD